MKPVRVSMLSLLLVVFMVAISSSGVMATELTFFHYSASHAPGLNNIAAAFNQLGLGITVRNDMLSTDYNTVLMSKDAAGELPHLFAASTAGEPALRPFIDAGKIQDVSHLKVIQALPEDFRESLVFSDGKIYMVPVNNAARGMNYNMALFEEAGIESVPTTLSELAEAVEKLQAAGITPFAVAGQDGWTLGSCIWQPGQEVYSTPEWLERRWAKEATFAENALPVFDLVDLIMENCQPNPMDTDYTRQIALFAIGEVAMVPQGSWFPLEVNAIDPAMVENMGFFPIPYTDDPARNGLYFDSNIYIVVNSAADLEAVDKYFDYMLLGEGREIFARDIRELNPYGIAFDGGPFVEDIFSYIDEGHIIGNFQYNNMPDGFWQVNATAMQEYISGQVDRMGMLQLLEDGWDSIVRN